MEAPSFDNDVVSFIRHPRYITVFKIVVSKASTLHTTLKDLGKTFNDVACIFEVPDAKGFIWWIKKNSISGSSFIYTSHKLIYVGGAQSKMGILSRVLILKEKYDNPEEPFKYLMNAEGVIKSSTGCSSSSNESL